MRRENKFVRYKSNRKKILSDNLDWNKICTQIAFFNIPRVSADGKGGGQEERRDGCDEEEQEEEEGGQYREAEAGQGEEGQTNRTKKKQNKKDGGGESCTHTHTASTCISCTAINLMQTEPPMTD